MSPPTVAPQIVLHDQNGKLFKLSSLRGKAVFLTFVYAHCPDVCPLMMQALGAAKRSLPDPSIMQIVAVSVDPKGDTPKVVKEFLRARELTGKAPGCSARARSCGRSGSRTTSTPSRCPRRRRSSSTSR